jgi:predicted Zn-dependent protease
MMAVALFAGIALFGALLQGPPAGAAEKARRAQELVQSGKPAEAVPIYKELAAAFPNEAGFGINLAIAQYKAGQYRDAIEVCQGLLKRQPDLFAAWLFLGASHFELSEPGEAVEPLRKALALRPGDRNVQVMLGYALFDQGRAAEAAAEFEKAAQTMPDLSRVQFGLARSYEALAKDAFLRLEEAAPGSAEWLALGADFELDRRHYAGAFQRYRQALAMRPGFPGLHAAVAGIYEKTGHTDWAATERAKETGSRAGCRDNPRACQTEAETLYWESKRYRELSQAAYARLRSLPPSTEGYEAEAMADEMGGRYPEAAAAWQQALALSPGDLSIRHRLALALCRANDCGSALPVIQDLLAREPASAELYLLYGTALKATEQPARALEYLEKAVKLDGHMLAARAGLGEAYLDADKPELAIPQLEAAVAEDRDGVRHFQLARAYRAVGKQERAAAVLREYREIKRRLQEEEPRITAP